MGQSEMSNDRNVLEDDNEESVVFEVLIKGCWTGRGSSFSTITQRFMRISETFCILQLVSVLFTD